MERCFVHIDYTSREVDDHDPKVPVEYKTQLSRDLPPLDKSHSINLSGNLNINLGGDQDENLNGTEPEWESDT